MIVPNPCLHAHFELCQSFKVTEKSRSLRSCRASHTHTHTPPHTPNTHTPPHTHTHKPYMITSLTTPTPTQLFEIKTKIT